MLKSMKFKLTIFVIAIVAPALAMAEQDGIAGVFERFITVLDYGVQALVIGGLFVGILLLVKAGMMMAKHTEDKREAPIKGIIMYALGGILLVGMTATSDTLQESLFGGDKAGDEAGFNVDSYVDKAGKPVSN